MRDSSDRGEEHSRARGAPAAEALVRSVPTVGGDDEAERRGGSAGAGAVLAPSTAIADDSGGVNSWGGSDGPGIEESVVVRVFIVGGNHGGRRGGLWWNGL